MVRAVDLTAIANKDAIYEVDPWFQRGLAATRNELSKDELWCIGTMIAKPEAVFTRRIGAILQYLSENDFRVVATRRIRFNRETVWQMWKYHWRAATPERRDLASELLLIGEALFFAVIDRRLPTVVPAAARLADLKGSTFPERRSSTQLRSVLGATSRLLNFVHTSDDPADVVREFALLFGAKERLDLLGEIGLMNDGSDAALAAMRELYEVHPQRSMDRELAFAATREALLDARELDQKQRRPAEEALALLLTDREQRGTLPWLKLKSQIVAACPDRDLWHPAIYASDRIAHDTVSREPDLPDGSVRDWMSRT
jgi:nucleoside diphosphate kinase